MENTLNKYGISILFATIASVVSIGYIFDVISLSSLVLTFFPSLLGFDVSVYVAIYKGNKPGEAVGAKALIITLPVIVAFLTLFVLITVVF